MSGQNKVTGVVLAGGLARRMRQQDKGLVLYKNQAMVSYALRAMAQVADTVLVSANRNTEQYLTFGYPVIADQTSSFDGPLAGILSALQVARTPVLLVTPCDSPLIEAGHLQRLLDARAQNDADIAVAFDGERIHPVFMAMRTCLQASLRNYLQQGNRKVDLWLPLHNWIKVDFSNEPDVFVNVNTLPELAELELSHQ